VAAGIVPAAFFQRSTRMSETKERLTRLLSQLEPAAIGKDAVTLVEHTSVASGPDGAVAHNMIALVTTVSTAISLKRIADALERTEVHQKVMTDITVERNASAKPMVIMPQKIDPQPAKAWDRDARPAIPVETSRHSGYPGDPLDRRGSKL